MTVYEIINRVWDDCGNPTDINPTSDPTYMVNTLNRSLEAMASWKGFQGRRKVFFPDYIAQKYVKNLREDELVATYTSEDVLTLVSSPSTFTVVDGDYVQFGDEYRFIYDTNGTDHALNDAFSTNPILNSPVTMCQRILDPDIDRLKTYLRVENVTEQFELQRQFKRNTDLSNIFTAGKPTHWKRENQKILLTPIPDSVYLWRVWYYRLPELAINTDYTGMTEEPDAPEDFHLAVMYYMQSLVYRQMQEIDSATDAYRVFDNLMKTTIGSWEQQNMLSGGGQVGVTLE